VVLALLGWVWGHAQDIFDKWKPVGQFCGIRDLNLLHIFVNLVLKFTLTRNKIEKHVGGVSPSRVVWGHAPWDFFLNRIL